jgi:predicted choloylglycine hydrolase
MRKRFVFEREDQPGEAWLARFLAGRQEAERWYLGGNRSSAPTAADCRAALRRHMPELMPQYERACALVGDDELAHCVISHYRPLPPVGGCTQAVWLGSGGPALIRNYDFPIEVVSDRFETTRWSSRRLIAKAQRPWGGCLDGMNDEGLVASLTAGGGQTRGLGFSVILILRYLLETCGNVKEAIEALRRIPIAATQNVTLLDRSGAYATLFLGPGRSPVISPLRACANHQEGYSQPASPVVRDSLQRQQIVLTALDDPAVTLPALISKFLAPPLYSRRAASATAYTAVYFPMEQRVDYLWPGKICSQSMGRFTPDAYVHDYSDLAA